MVFLKRHKLFTAGEARRPFRDRRTRDGRLTFPEFRFPLCRMMLSMRHCDFIFGVLLLR
jgi:hypothetical protein